MLASTIQFTTNTPTPTQTNHHKKAITCNGGIRSGALLQNPDSMPSQTPSLFAKKTGQVFKRILNGSSRRSKTKLLRKEVIQPHLPVRLPCYDFVPIASPTFNRSP